MGVTSHLQLLLFPVPTPPPQCCPLSPVSTHVSQWPGPLPLQRGVVWPVMLLETGREGRGQRPGSCWQGGSSQGLLLDMPDVLTGRGGAERDRDLPLTQWLDRKDLRDRCPS